MHMPTCKIDSFDVTNQRVFLRADLNVPLKNGIIQDDYKLQAILPTIDLIKQKGGKIILASHLGRPTTTTHASSNSTSSEPQKESDLSLKQLMPWFEGQGYKIHFVANLQNALELSNQHNDEIVLLENLRLYPGEKTKNKQEAQAFAQQLKLLADYYINDAFATLHRSDTSITILPQLFAPDKKSIGPLIEKELKGLQPLVESPKQPFVVICGGGKVADKLPMLTQFLNKAQTILLCPAIAETFAKAIGKEVGKSLVDGEALEQAKLFLKQAQEKKVYIGMPVDYQIAMNTFDGPLSEVLADAFPASGVAVSIGHRTAKLYEKEIKKAGTLFFNGLPGTITRPETLFGAQSIFHAMGKSSGYSVIGGGDSVAAAHYLKEAKHISYLSTGGGAALAYLAGEQLPGLAFI